MTGKKIDERVNVRKVKNRDKKKQEYGEESGDIAIRRRWREREKRAKASMTESHCS